MSACSKKLNIAPGSVVMACAVALVASASAADLPAYDPSGRTDIPPSIKTGTLDGAFDSRFMAFGSGTLATLDSRAVVSVSSRGSNVNARRPGAQIIFR